MIWNTFYRFARIRISIKLRKNCLYPPGVEPDHQKIEKELGAEILKRTNYGVDLTDEGQVFIKHARQITEHMVFLNREIEQLANVETGQLFISISYGMFSFYKAKCILDF